MAEEAKDESKNGLFLRKPRIIPLTQLRLLHAHACGELRARAYQSDRYAHWLGLASSDFGGLIFVDLRDREEFDPDSV